jgi:toxin ParE1/3/4
MNVRWLPKSSADLVAHVDFLTDQSPAAAYRFLESVEKTCEIIVSSPFIGSVVDALRPHQDGIRMWPVRHFRSYLLLYRPVNDQIEIVRLLHGASDWEVLDL